MSITNSLRRFGEGLRTLGAGHEYNVFHYWRPLMSTPFVVWRETGERDTFHSDNRKSEIIMSIDVDVFTTDEFDPLIDAVFDYLNGNSIPFTIENVEFETDTKVIHYAINCEMAVK